MNGGANHRGDGDRLRDALAAFRGDGRNGAGASETKVPEKTADEAAVGPGSPIKNASEKTTGGAAVSVRGGAAVSVRRDAPLQALNTLAAPSCAAHFARLAVPADAAPLLELARERDWPVRVLGGGSNVVLGERLPGLTVRQACRGIEVLSRDGDGVRLRAAAGEDWHGFVRWCLGQGYCGLENLALIPGTVGAAPIQNVGAYGVEVGAYIETVACRSLRDGGERFFSRAECGFGYRDSVFRRELRDEMLIESVTFRLPRRQSPETAYPVLRDYLAAKSLRAPDAGQVFEAVVAIRRSRLPDPKVIPNAGSFFKNPVVGRAALDKLLADWPALPHYLSRPCSLSRPPAPSPAAPSPAAPTPTAPSPVAPSPAVAPTSPDVPFPASESFAAPSACQLFTPANPSPANLDSRLRGNDGQPSPANLDSRLRGNDEQLSPAAPPAVSNEDQFKLSAAWLIEQCGFKAQQERLVRVHREHALVIVNPRRRPATEIAAFAGEIAAAVAERFGLQLEQEPRSYE